MSDKLINDLTQALMFLVNNDPQTDHEVALARNEHPVLRHLTDEQLREFSSEIADNVHGMVCEAAAEFVQGINLFRACRCLNPRCDIETLGEAALEAHYPDPKLLETLAPGDTIPLGLCPECGGPIYQPEDFPEDEVDASHRDEMDPNCGCKLCVTYRKANPGWDQPKSVVDPQHKDPARPPVEHCGCRSCVAKRCVQVGFPQNVTEAIAAGASDSTEVSTEGSTDCTGNYDPLYTD